MTLPVSEDTKFHAMLQRGNRVQVPVVVRWRFKLEPGEILKVGVKPLDTWHEEIFWAKLQKGGRITIPKRVREVLEAHVDRDMEPGELLKIVIEAEE